MALDIASEPPAEESHIGPHVVIVEGADDIAAICGKMDMAMSGQVIVVVRRMNRSLRSEVGLPRIKKHALNTGRMMALVTRNRELRARARQLEIPVFGSVKRVRFGDRKPWVLSFGVMSLVIPKPAPFNALRFLIPAAIVGAAVVAAYLLLPSATVTIYPETETVARVLSVTAATSVNQPNPVEFAVPARPNRVSVPIEITGPVTGGDAIVGDKFAVGGVQFVNRGESAVYIPLGTILSTDDGKQFSTLAAVQLPAVRDSSVTISAQSLKPGDAGNIESGLIKHGEGISESVGVTNERTFSGGTNRTIKLVTENDANNLKAVARRKGRELGIQQVAATSNSQIFPIAESVEVGLTDENFNAKVGEPADYLTYNTTAVLNFLALDNADLARVTLAELQPSGEGMALLPTSVSAKPVLIRGYNPIDQRADVDVLTTASASRPISIDRITAMIAGKPKDEAQLLIQREVPTRSVQIDSMPSWLGLPRLAQRITVRVQP